MFEFVLSIKVSLVLVGAGRRLSGCAATERSPVGSWFSATVFHIVHGAVPERVQWFYSVRIHELLKNLYREKTYLSLHSTTIFSKFLYSKGVVEYIFDHVIFCLIFLEVRKSGHACFPSFMSKKFSVFLGLST